MLSAELGALVRDGIEVVTPLTRDELERAIVRPAAAVGVELEPGLAADLEADVVDRPGALPLLQFALTELFERADGKRLSRESYAAIGGVAGAVGRRAEAVFAALDQASRDVARQLFLRLAAVGEGRNVAARRVVVDDLRSIEPTPERVDAVLEAFGRWRLLAFDRDPRTGRATVEPAHEALLTHWPRLAGWIQEAEEALWMEGRLEATATEWAAANRDPGFLLSGSRLDLFEAWSATTDIRLDALERELLEASLAERRRAESAETRSPRPGAAARTSGVDAAPGARGRAARGRRRGLGVARRRLAAGGGRPRGAGDRHGARAGGRRERAARRGSRLALLLAVEAARATADRGWITEEALDALHWAIQEARIPYPTEDVPVAVRLALDGARGVYLLPVTDLIDLAETGAGRLLTTAECRAYLHQPACPVAGRDWSDADLAVMTADGPVAMEALADEGIPGASLRVFSQLPADLAGALVDYAAEGQGHLHHVGRRHRRPTVGGRAGGRRHPRPSRRCRRPRPCRVAPGPRRHPVAGRGGNPRGTPAGRPRLGRTAGASARTAKDPASSARRSRPRHRACCGTRPRRSRPPATNLRRPGRSWSCSSSG